MKILHVSMIKRAIIKLFLHKFMFFNIQLRIFLQLFKHILQYLNPISQYFKTI